MAGWIAAAAAKHARVRAMQTPTPLSSHARNNINRYVRTPMTGGAGLIDVDTSVAGMLSVLEGSKPLAGRWYAFDGKEIPW